MTQDGDQQSHQENHLFPCLACHHHNDRLEIAGKQRDPECPHLESHRLSEREQVYQEGRHHESIGMQLIVGESEQKSPEG